MADLPLDLCATERRSVCHEKLRTHWRATERRRRETQREKGCASDMRVLSSADTPWDPGLRVTEGGFWHDPRHGEDGPPEAR